MDKIDLSSIENRKAAVVKTVTKPTAQPKANSALSLDQCLMPKSDKATTSKPSTYKPSPQSIPETPPLSEYERLKKIKILELYRLEFDSDKLGANSKKNFSKCSDEQLDEIKKEFDYNVGTSSNLQMGVNMSQQLLTIYEYVGTNFVGLEIEGISKMGQTDEWRDNVKALCLRYMSTPVSHIEPEHKLMFMLISNTLMLHQINTANNKSLPTQTEIDVDIIIDKPVSAEDNITNKLKLANLNNQYNDL